MNPMIKPFVVLAAVSVIGCGAGTPATSTGSAGAVSPKSVELQTAMRKLWADHVPGRDNTLSRRSSTTPVLRPPPYDC